MCNHHTRLIPSLVLMSTCYRCRLSPCRCTIHTERNTLTCTEAFEGSAQINISERASECQLSSNAWFLSETASKRKHITNKMTHKQNLPCVLYCKYLATVLPESHVWECYLLACPPKFLDLTIIWGGEKTNSLNPVVTVESCLWEYVYMRFVIAKTQTKIKKNAGKQHNHDPQLRHQWYASLSNFRILFMSLVLSFAFSLFHLSSFPF